MIRKLPGSSSCLLNIALQIYFTEKFPKIFRRVFLKIQTVFFLGHQWTPLDRWIGSSKEMTVKFTGTEWLSARKNTAAIFAYCISFSHNSVSSCQGNALNIYGYAFHSFHCTITHGGPHGNFTYLLKITVKQISNLPSLKIFHECLNTSQMC